MRVAFSAEWASVEPFMRGLKFGGLMNQALKQDDIFRLGRHHFMTAINQILEWGLTLELLSQCLQAAHIHYSLAKWNIVKFMVPVGTAYLASRQMKILHISETANFVQNHLGKLSLVVMTVASVTLFALGQTLLATTTMIYLTVGILDRYNVLSESTQRVIHLSNFFIGNFTGLYLGGNFVRVVCTLNLIVAAIKKYFEYKRLTEEKERTSLPIVEKEEKDSEIELEIEKNFSGTRVSLEELRQWTHHVNCPIRKAHIHERLLPSVNEGVQVEDILELYKKINWSQHQHVLEGVLRKDKRWLEIEQFQSKPLEYFESNLTDMIMSIKNHTILQAQPKNYEMLEYYCRYIAQELKNENEMAQADALISLGIEGGPYCGVGKFKIAEEIFESLLSQAVGLSLETRLFATLQQERQCVWQNLYEMVWTTNPFTQCFGYLSEINSIHNINVFTNLIQAGEKFGIPDQVAKNDQTASINPITHYLAFSFITIVEDCFWKGRAVPQCYFDFNIAQRADWWKVWKWVHLKWGTVSPRPYNEERILERFSETIGSPQIPKTDIYSWWLQWIDRQEDLSEEQKEKLIEELETTPVMFNGEPFEVEGKIQPKFLKAMLIEMGVLDKPEFLSQEYESIDDD